MSATDAIKPKHKALQAYYATLRAYSASEVRHEGALETAFQQLLGETAKARGWMLVPKLSFKRAGKSIIPDGTIRDDFNLHRGYWEAKDTDDDLTHEIQKKTAKGYPLTNTIFEKMKVAKDRSAVIVNRSLTLAGIPSETFRYRLGNRSALEWVIDQYQLSQDKRSGVRSDPNRADGEEYIVRLVGQVVRVSIETVRIVESLPAFEK